MSDHNPTLVDSVQAFANLHEYVQESKNNKGCFSREAQAAFAGLIIGGLVMVKGGVLLSRRELSVRKANGALQKLMIALKSDRAEAIALLTRLKSLGVAGAVIASAGIGLLLAADGDSDDTSNERFMRVVCDLTSVSQTSKDDTISAHYTKDPNAFFNDFLKLSPREAALYLSDDHRLRDLTVAYNNLVHWMQKRNTPSDCHQHQDLPPHRVSTAQVTNAAP